MRRGWGEHNEVFGNLSDAKKVTFKDVRWQMRLLGLLLYYRVAESEMRFQFGPAGPLASHGSKMIQNAFLRLGSVPSSSPIDSTILL